MRQVLPGIFDWIALHMDIEKDVYSHYLTATELAMLTDSSATGGAHPTDPRNDQALRRTAGKCVLFR